MKDVGEHKNLGTGVEGNLRRGQGATSPAGEKGKKGKHGRPKKITEKKLRTLIRDEYKRLTSTV